MKCSSSQSRNAASSAFTLPGQPLGVEHEEAALHLAQGQILTVRLCRHADRPTSPDLGQVAEGDVAGVRVFRQFVSGLVRVCGASWVPDDVTEVVDALLPAVARGDREAEPCHEVLLVG